jgi:hypothetical protein
LRYSVTGIKKVAKEYNKVRNNPAQTQKFRIGAIRESDSFANLGGKKKSGRVIFI